jgi:LPXTG-motif cell wall-anchored protein
VGLFSSKSSQTTTNDQRQFYTDARSVADAGGGILGDGNVFDQSQTYLSSTTNNIDAADRSTHYTDASDRSTSSVFSDFSNRSTTTIDAADRSTHYTDASDRSTSSVFSDFSNRSITTIDAADRSTHYTDTSNRSITNIDAADRSTNISTDGGAFAIVQSVADGVADTSRLQVDLTRRMAELNAGTGNMAFEFAQRAQESAAGFNTAALRGSFDLAAQAAANGRGSIDAALGFARETWASALQLADKVTDQAGQQADQAATVAAGAYQSAADTSSGNRTLVLAGLAVVGLAAGFFFFRKA